MTLSLLTVSTRKLRQLMIIAPLLLTSACHASDQVAPALAAEPTMETKHVTESNKPGAVSTVTQTPECPIVSSKNWRAKVVANDDGELTLSISGDIELPNPGYSVIFEQDVADKLLPVSQHFTIKTKRLSGFYIQAITPMTLEHSGPTMAAQTRSIVIHCGGQIIATIEDVNQNS